MSRSGYTDEIEDPLVYGRYRAQVASAIRGRRGQAFLRDLVDALEAMPVKRLIEHELQQGGDVCALGSVGVRRGVDLTKLDPYDHKGLSSVFGIAPQLIKEIEWENDDGDWRLASPEQRWQRMRDWAANNLLPEKQPSPSPSERKGQ